MCNTVRNLFSSNTPLPLILATLHFICVIGPEFRGKCRGMGVLKDAEDVKMQIFYVVNVGRLPRRN